MRALHPHNSSSETSPPLQPIFVSIQQAPNICSIARTPIFLAYLMSTASPPPELTGVWTAAAASLWFGLRCTAFSVDSPHQPTVLKLPGHPRSGIGVPYTSGLRAMIDSEYSLPLHTIRISNDDHAPEDSDPRSFPSRLTTSLTPPQPPPPPLLLPAAAAV